MDRWRSEASVCIRRRRPHRLASETDPSDAKNHSNQHFLPPPAPPLSSVLDVFRNIILWWCWGAGGGRILIKKLTYLTYFLIKIDLSNLINFDRSNLT